MKKLNVAVLMGGKSSEYEVSMVSGREVVRNLDKEKFEVLPVVISKDGKNWIQVSQKEILASRSSFERKNKKPGELALFEKGKVLTSHEMGENGIDVVFIALHGPFGEDGSVQGMLELSGLTYTGSGVLASALGMDKLIFRKLLLGEGISIPKYVAIRKGENINEIHQKLGNPPYFVKPHNQGSSVGVSLVREKFGLKKALAEAFKFSDVALIDEYVKGKELTCALIGNENPTALGVVEIVPKKGEFFNYQSKYSRGGADEIVPARIPQAWAKRVQEEAKRVYKLIGCRGFGRVDFILRDNGDLVVLEINTIPGLTPASLFPKAARSAGISYRDLLTQVINYALIKV